MRNSRPPHRFLVLGTDTDVGKTYVSAALCSALLHSGIRVTACKPVETGAPAETDLDIIARLCDRDERLTLRPALRYALAAAPTAAAAAEGLPAPSAADIESFVRSLESEADAIVVETCGGALTPLRSTDYVIDLAARLPEYTAVLVAGLRLGVLSHALGAAEYLRSRGLPMPLVVLNDRYARSPQWYVDSTRADLRARGLEVVAYLGHDVAPADADLSLLLSAAS